MDIAELSPVHVTTDPDPVIERQKKFYFLSDHLATKKVRGFLYLWPLAQCDALFLRLVLKYKDFAAVEFFLLLRLSDLLAIVLQLVYARRFNANELPIVS